MKKIVVLTGAGISAESGIKTFRDADGLWEGHRVEDVASPEGWKKNRQLVLDFYNARRRQLDEVEPNDAHKLLASLEDKFKVVIITQNVDDLHERGGSKDVIHLHGELKKMCSSNNKNLTLPYEADIKIGDKHEDGSQLRPFIVWFGEDVPKMSEAIDQTYDADVFVIIGTSLQVYPAASLVNYTKTQTPIYIIDNKEHNVMHSEFNYIIKPATEGVKELIDILNKSYGQEI